MTGKTPHDGIEAKFSIYHGAACGLLFGKATPAECEDEVVVQTAELRKKENRGLHKYHEDRAFRDPEQWNNATDQRVGDRLANRVKALDVQVFDAIEARDLFGSLVGEDNLKDLLVGFRLAPHDVTCARPPYWTAKIWRSFPMSSPFADTVPTRLLSHFLSVQAIFLYKTQWP